MDRRQFINKNALLLAGLGTIPTLSFASVAALGTEFTSRRPAAGERTFISKEVDRLIVSMKSVIADPELAWMFENCYPNTLDTTVDFEMIDGKPDTFIITGDIDAMWLRDSTAQVWPYMPLIVKEEKLRLLIQGLINRQVKCVLRDPYANAFYKDLSRESEWASDIPSPIPGVHERKWEVDSLCYIVRLSYHYYKLTGDSLLFDEDWNKAMRMIVKTFRTEQRMDGSSPYRFVRRTHAMIDAPVFGGTGRPVKPTGLICSMFRPSDDATLYPYLVPSNLFARKSLEQLAEIFSEIDPSDNFALECRSFAEEIGEAIEKFAIAEHLDFGEIYAYEVDGFGNKVFMDDANVPSLISLVYLEIHEPSDKLYTDTRAFLLSDSNPYFLKGTAASGQASPHTGKDMIWPMGIILRAMTSTDEEEILKCLSMLKTTHAGTGFMHEAFDKDDPSTFNRAWFAWANTLFGELIIKISGEFPGLLNQKQI